MSLFTHAANIRKFFAHDVFNYIINSPSDSRTVQAATRQVWTTWTRILTLYIAGLIICSSDDSAQYKVPHEQDPDLYINNVGFILFPPVSLLGGGRWWQKPPPVFSLNIFVGLLMLLSVCTGLSQSCVTWLHHDFLKGTKINTDTEYFVTLK